MTGFSTAAVWLPRPALAVEVRSESTWRRDVGPKRRLYVEREVPEYWIVNDDERTITVVRPVEADLVATDTLQWQPAHAPVPLLIRLADVFAGPA